MLCTSCNVYEAQEDSALCVKCWHLKQPSFTAQLAQDFKAFYDMGAEDNDTERAALRAENERLRKFEQSQTLVTTSPNGADPHGYSEETVLLSDVLATENAKLRAENARLSAEVEALTAELATVKEERNALGAFVESSTRQNATVHTEAVKRITQLFVEDISEIIDAEKPGQRVPAIEAKLQEYTRRYLVELD